MNNEIIIVSQQKKLDDLFQIVNQKYDRYDGQYKDGFKNGRGIFHYSSGHIFHGQWKNDKRRWH